MIAPARIEPMAPTNGTPQPQPPEPDEALFALLARLLRGGGDWRVTMEHAGRRLELTVGPDAPAAPPAPPAPGELTECERDVLALLEGQGQRMTGDAIKAHFSRENILHGESTINHALADLVHRKRLLNNKRDGRGRGYGLADWD